MQLAYAKEATTKKQGGFFAALNIACAMAKCFKLIVTVIVIVINGATGKKNLNQRSY